MASVRPAKGHKRPAAGEGAVANGNRSVVVAVRLLKIIAAIEGPATLGKIADVASMSASRTHRYLAGLIHAGLVEQDIGTGRYALGATIVELGLIALGKNDVVKLGSAALVALTERTGLVSLLCTWGTHGPTIIKWENGHIDTALRIREGRNLPLLTTAAGRVFLAYQAAEYCRPLLEREIEANSVSTAKSKRLTQENAEKLRANVLLYGLGRMVGEENPGLSALAAPVFNHENELAMTVGIISIIGTFDDSYDGAPAKVLKDCANQLSRQLGAPSSRTATKAERR